MRPTRINLGLICLFGIMLAVPVHAQNHIFDPIDDCVRKDDYWDHIDKICKPHEPDKPFAEMKLMKDCVWKNQVFELDATRHLEIAFRYQSCGTEKRRYLFDQATGALYQYSIAPANRVAEFRDYAPGSLATLIEQINKPTLKEDEQPDCEVMYLHEVRGFAYAPSHAYLQDMMLGPPSFTLCGDHGFNTGKMQFFRVLSDKILVYFRIDKQGDPLDVQSFQLQ
jgi:hypothetical protein